MKPHTSLRPLILLAASLLLAATPAPAQTTTFSGAVAGTDSWNTAGNWDNGVPTGAEPPHTRSFEPLSSIPVAANPKSDFNPTKRIKTMPVL